MEEMREVPHDEDRSLAVAYGGLLKCLEVFMLFEVDLVWFSRFSGLWWTLDRFVALGQIRCARSLARSQAEQAKLPWEFKAAPCDGTVPGRWCMKSDEIGWNRMKSDDPYLIIMFRSHTSGWSPSLTAHAHTIVCWNACHTNHSWTDRRNWTHLDGNCRFVASRCCLLWGHRCEVGMIEFKKDHMHD